MLSLETLSRINELDLHQPDYRASEAVRRDLGNKILTMPVSPTNSGKTTIMRAALERFPSKLSIAGTLTTRAERESDDPNLITFFPHTDAGIDELYGLVREHKLVQYKVHPAGNIYGSLPEHYKGDNLLGDRLANTVSDFKDLGFARTRPVSIATPDASWLERFEIAFPPGHKDRAARQKEAIDSTVWSLDQPLDPDMHGWVLNVPGVPALGGLALGNLALDVGKSNITIGAARAMAHQLLRTAQGIKA